MELQRLMHASDIVDYNAFRNAVSELDAAGLVKTGDAVELEMSVTDTGRETSYVLSVVPAQGRVTEYATGLDEVRLAVLDVVVEQELRVAGRASVKLSTIRTRVRRSFKQLDIPAATRTIEGLVGQHLTANSGDEPSYRTTLRGFLVSQWGSNLLYVVGEVLGHLRDVHNAAPSTPQYSWRALRTRARLPHKALNLAYDAIHTFLAFVEYKHM